MNAICVGHVKAPDMPAVINAVFDLTDKLKMEPGNFIACELEEKKKTKLYICCHGCGQSSFTGDHIITRTDNLYSATPSLIFMCCKWHGYLKNNTFAAV